MKKILPLLIFISMLCLKCNTGHLIKSRDNTIIVTGKVTNQDLMNPFVTITPNRIAVGREQIKADLDEEGNFKASFASSVPIDLFVLYKTNFLVLAYPGDSIYIEFDGSADDRPALLKKIKFGGDHSEMNKDASAFQLMRFSDNFYEDLEKRYSLMDVYDPAGFRSYMDSCRMEWYNMLARFEKKHKPDKEVMKWAKTSLDVDCYRDLLRYAVKYRQKTAPGSPERSVSRSYLDFMEDRFPVDSSCLICGYSLFGFVDSYATYIMEIIQSENPLFFRSAAWFKEHPEVFDSLRFFGAIKHTPEPLLRQMALTEMLYEGLEFSRVSIFEKYKREIDSIITEPYLKVPLFREYNATLDRLNNPAVASGIIMSKLKGKQVLVSVDSILKLNKGKVIYLDCWATWCGPCMAEMPFSVKLIKEFTGKDITFVFVCIDSEEKNWKSALSKYELRGQHLLLDKPASLEFRQIFRIDGIPHYILFGKDGKVIEENALPPSGIRSHLKELV